MNARGTYVRLGRGGIYYQKYLNTSAKGASSLQPLPLPIVEATLTPVTTADASALSDSSAAELLTEIQEKNSKTELAPIIAIGSALVIIALLILAVPLWACGVFAVIAAAVHFQAQRFDVKRKGMFLRYDLDKEVTANLMGLLSACSSLSNASALWRLTAKDTCLAPKYNAGAGTLIDRKRASISVKAPGVIETNLAVWRLDLGWQRLYFMPDRLLVEQSGTFGAVEYADLIVQDEITRFIESDNVPGDTRIVDYTWRYTNKHGGPDHRFSHNPQIPVVLYGEIHLRSASGLHIALQVSDPAKAQGASQGLRAFVQSRYKSSTLSATH